MVRETLNIYAIAAAGVFCLGTLLLVIRVAYAAIRFPLPVITPRSTVDPPELRRRGDAVRLVLAGPIRRFHLAVNRAWTAGYLLYHVAIIMLVAGYLLSGLLLASHLLRGGALPDIETGFLSPQSLSPANITAYVFGDAEPIQREYLFGGYAPLFYALTWGDVAIAATGNCFLLVTLLLRRSGAVRGDLDAAAAGVRTRGFFPASHFPIRFMIFALILSEIAGRLGLYKGAVWYHALIGMTILMLIPLLYLRHIFLAPVAIAISAHRRRRGIVA